MRSGSGKAVLITGDEATPLRNTSESGAALILCSECEHVLNLRFDAYGIEALKESWLGCARAGDSAIFRHLDRQRFRMFLLTTLWRMSLSDNNLYRKVSLHPGMLETIRADVLAHRPSRSMLATPIIGVLGDTTPKVGLTHEDIHHIVMAPFMRHSPQFDAYAFAFIMFGFLIEIYTPRIPSRFYNQPGVLRGSARGFLAPHRELLDIPEMMEVMLLARAKQESGLGSAALRKR